jgi:hypothetical protein
MQIKKGFLLLGVIAIGSLSIAKPAAAQTKNGQSPTPVETVAPSQPFQAQLNTFGGQAGPTFSVGPAQGTLAVTSLILTNLNSVVERVQIFQPSNPDACGLNAQIGGPGSIHMDLLVQPQQTLSLPFPSPLVFNPINGHSCIGISGGQVAGIVIVQVTGFVN